MKFQFLNKRLIISLPNKNKGKFRFKKINQSGYPGASFPTKRDKFDSSVYLEWQIGYDISVKDIESGNKRTALKGAVFGFKGANSKEKRPYELAEFLYILLKEKVLDVAILDSLQKELESYNEFIVSTPKVRQKGETEINSLLFDSAVTEFPTYIYHNKDGTYIEAIVQKRQYAFGFQPMVYFCIPLLCFANGKEALGHNSQDKSLSLQYYINTENSDNILVLFKILAMASQSHQNDIVQILKVLKKGLEL